MIIKVTSLPTLVPFVPVNSENQLKCEKLTDTDSDENT